MQPRRKHRYRELHIQGRTKCSFLRFLTIIVWYLHRGCCKLRRKTGQKLQFSLVSSIFEARSKPLPQTKKEASPRFDSIFTLSTVSVHSLPTKWLSLVGTMTPSVHAAHTKTNFTIIWASPVLKLFAPSHDLAHTHRLTTNNSIHNIVEFTNKKALLTTPS